MENGAAPTSTARAAFRVNDLFVEPDSGQVTGPGGTVQLEPRVMAVLLALAQSPGHPVSRNKLLADIWPGGQVYDEALTQCIYQLRQQLAHAGGNDSLRDLVRTLPKRGYLLDAEVAPVKPEVDAPAEAPSPVSGTPLRSRSSRLALPVLVLVALAAWWSIRSTDRSEPGSFAPEEFTVAVLPFHNATGNAQRDHLSEGVSDGLRERVAAIPTLRVASRRSSGSFRDSVDNPGDIGRQLRVRHLVEGRFDSERGMTRISVELVDTRSGFVAWTRVYERPDRELLLAEQELAMDLLRQLLPGQELPSYPEPTPRQVANHELMLLAREYAQRVSDFQAVDTASLERAVELYRQVLDRDPDSVEAHARLGRLLLYAGEVVAAEPHVLRTLDLDPGRADAYTSLGLYLWSVREDGVGAAWRRAVELNPSDPETLAYLASWTWMQGDAAAATELYTRALEVDPRSLVRYADLGFRLAMSGDRERVQALLQELLRLFPDRAGHLAASRISETLGDLDEAVAQVLLARLPDSEDDEVEGLLAALLARLGDADTAARFEPVPGVGSLYWQRQYTALIERGEDLQFEQPGDLDLQFMLAFAQAALGDYDAAIGLYEATGLPEIALAESRRAPEVQALLAYGCTLRAAGREEEARQYVGAARTFTKPWYDGDRAHNWLARTAEAMSLVVLGDEAGARALLESLPEVETLPWLPWLRDSTCFSGWQGQAWYDAAVAAVEARTRAQLQRLPESLARHGVQLPD